MDSTVESEAPAEKSLAEKPDEGKAGQSEPDADTTAACKVVVDQKSESVVGSLSDNEKVEDPVDYFGVSDESEDQELIHATQTVEQEDALNKSLRESELEVDDKETEIKLIKSEGQARDEISEVEGDGLGNQEEEKLPETVEETNVDSHDSKADQEVVKDVLEPIVEAEADALAVQNLEHPEQGEETIAEPPATEPNDGEITDKLEITGQTGDGDKSMSGSANQEETQSGAAMSTKSDDEIGEKRSGTPEQLISLLKQLTPEKLEVIKAKIFPKLNEAASSNNKEESQEPMEIENDEITNSKQVDNDHKVQEASASTGAARAAEDDEPIILLDSDEEEMLFADKQNEISDTIKNLLHIPSKSESTGSVRKRSQSETEGNKKTVKRIKECVNPECVGDSADFTECDLFVMSFYFVGKKENRSQYVCSTCFEKAVLKYEEMGSALLNGTPLISIPMHKKHEMIEVIDSDEENEPYDLPALSDSEKIRFGPQDEKLCEDVLKSICNKIDIRQQMKWQQTDFLERCAKIEREHAYITNELRIMDKKSSVMYNDLYSINRPKTRELPPLIFPHDATAEIDFSHPQPGSTAQSRATVEAAIASLQKNNSIVLSSNQSKQNSPTVPQQRVVIYPSHSTAPPSPDSIALRQVYFANRSLNTNRMQSWSPCQKLEVTGNPQKKYKVKFFDGNNENEVAYVDGKNFALNTINHKLQIGARVVAQFRLMPSVKIGKFYPGVIGEKLSNYNNHRYLVFCDYGQVQYVNPQDVREVAEMSPNVWDDVHPNLCSFIRDYLLSQTQRQRALLNVRKNQHVLTEKNGGFKTAQVVEIDCSIMRMLFVHDETTEWLYRGSKRLQPIFNQEHTRNLTTNARRVNPNISYTTIDEEDPQQAATQPSRVSTSLESGRNIAKKSTSGKAQAQPQPVQSSSNANNVVKILNDSQIYLDEPKEVSKLKHFTPKASIKPKKYVSHECSPRCLKPLTSKLDIYSPLSKPLLTYWERQIVRQKNSRMVMYKAPCGRRLRDMFEVRQYLILTKCHLNVDNFDFDPWIQVLSSFDVIDRSLCPLYIPDMTEGMEKMKIPVVNAFDNQPPPALKYSNVRIPMQGVKIPTEVEFRACCSCTDDCADKTKCECFQMTIQGYKFANQGIDFDEGEVSYRWKRLLMQVPTGIYECHSGCHCTDRCLNKVVQLPIQVKMQLFRTKDRGWGLESICDIPKGSFICIYAGRLYREDDANALATGTDHGDEYYAELDLIETASQIKEGYEEGVVYPSDSEGSDSDSDYDHSKDNDTSFVSTARNLADRNIITRSTGGVSKNKRRNLKEADDNSNSEDGEIVNMEPSEDAPGNSTENASGRSRMSLRRLYGKNEKPYVMDARTVGNVGRYFNHSCDPNLFVQSVMVDTHDLRFPWIAFFANRPIKAGEELTWNYNYEVGSVPSKMLHCKCGSKNCRGRIL